MPGGPQFCIRGTVNDARKKALAADRTHLSLIASSSILVQDGQGRKTGYDPITQAVYDQIPGAYYVIDSVANDSSGDPADEFLTQIYLPGSRKPYTITLSSTRAGRAVLENEFAGGDGTLQSKEFENIQLEPGAGVSISLNSDGSITPPPAPPSKGFVEVQQSQYQYQQGTPISGLVWERIWPTNPEIDVKLEALLDGNPFRLVPMGKHFWAYTFVPLGPGIHELEIRVELAGELVDDLVTYLRIAP